MAYSLLGSVKGRSTNLNTFTTPAVDTTGATLIVVGFTDYVAGGGTPGVLSDSFGNTWTGLGATSASGGTIFTSQLYYCANPTVGAGHTFTDTGTTRIGSMVVAFFTGNTATPLDGHTGADTLSGATEQPGSITPVANNELIITHSNGWTNGTTATIDSSFTIIDQETGVASQSGASALAYLVQTTAGAVNPTWTWSGSTGVAATMASFKAAAGAAFAAARPTVVGQGINRASTF